jgi:hypothetical protein
MSHGAVIVLLVVVGLVLVSPDKIVIFVELIKLLDDLAGSNLDNLLVIFIVVPSSSGLFALTLLGFFFLTFAFGFFSTTSAAFTALIVSIAILVFFLDTFIKAFDIFRGLTSLGCLNLLDPLSPFFEHALSNLILFHFVDLSFDLVLSVHVLAHVRLLNLFPLIHGLLCPINRICTRLSRHAQENHFLLTDLVNAFTS